MWILRSFIVDGTQIPGAISFYKGTAGHVITTKRPHCENHCYFNPHFSPVVDRQTAYHPKSLIALPVVDSSGKAVGIAELLNKLRGELTEKDIHIVNTFTAVPAVTLENSRLQSVQQVSCIDVEMMKWIEPPERIKFDMPASQELGKAENG
jgi:GAF domain-containing protein